MEGFSTEYRAYLKSEGHCDFIIGILERIRPTRVERPVFDKRNAEDVGYIDLRKLSEKQVVYVGATHPSAAYLMRVDEVDGERRLRIWMDSPYRGDSWCFEGSLDDFPNSFLSHHDEDSKPRDLALSVGRPTTFPYFTFFGERLIPDTDNLDWTDTVQEIKIGVRK